MSDPREVLESWKEIAAYLGRSVRAVQLWEKEERLPIHRHQHDKQGSVFAYRDEIDRWREARSAPRPSVAPRVPFPSKLAVVVLAAAVILTVFGALWKRGTSIHSIAVLPFTGDVDHMSDGLTELLIDELAAMPELRVMARSSVFQYKNKPAVRAGKDLDVGAVITGEVRRASDRYIVRVELIDTRDGAQLWAQRYDTAKAELPSLQQRIAADLSPKLGIRVAPVANYAASPEAYEQYLLGLREWNRRTGGGVRNVQALRNALAHFQRAIDLDPKFAAAHAGVANTYGVLIGYGEIAPDEGTMHVLRAARKALELDPNNAEAYTSIASTSFRSLRDFPSAERDYRRALELTPSFATAHQWYGEYLLAMGRFAEARREIESAYRLDPLSGAITGDLCWTFYYERRYREAIRFGLDVEARDPGRAPAWCIGAALLSAGDFEGFFAFRSTHGELPMPESFRDAYRRGGPRGFYTARLQNLGRSGAAGAFALARAHALAGDADRAFTWLEKSLERNDSAVTSFHLYPDFDSLRDDPRFDDLARRIGLPQSAIDATRALATAETRVATPSSPSRTAALPSPSRRSSSSSSSAGTASAVD